MHALGVPAGHVQVAGLFCAAAQHYGIKICQQLLGGHGTAHIHAGAEHNTFGLHQLDPALDDCLVQLHVGDAVHQKASHAVGAFKHRDGVAALVQVLGH